MIRRLALALSLLLALAACGGTTAPTATPVSTATTGDATSTDVLVTDVPTGTPDDAPAATPAPTLAPAQVAATATAASTAGTPASAPAPTKTNGPPDVVRVVHVPGLFFAPLYVAVEQGYFNEQHIDVRLTNAASGTEAVAGLAQGQVDVGAIGLSAATFNALNQGADFRVIASASLGPKTNSPTKLEVRRALVDAGIVHTVADLKGRKIAVAGGTGSAGAYLAVKVLQTMGLAARDVTFVNLTNPDIVPALTNGAVDAALIATPFATQAVDSGVAKVISDGLTPGYSTTAYTYSAAFARDRQDVARRFTMALLKGYRAVQGESYLSDANVRAYVKYIGGPEKTIRDTPPLVYDPHMGIARESIVDQEKVYRESGWTDYKTTIDITKLFDTSFVDYARSVSG